MTFYVSPLTYGGLVVSEALQLGHVTLACDTARFDDIKGDRCKHLECHGFDSRWEDSEFFLL